MKICPKFIESSFLSEKNITERLSFIFLKTQGIVIALRNFSSEVNRQSVVSVCLSWTFLIGKVNGLKVSIGEVRQGRSVGRVAGTSIG